MKKGSTKLIIAMALALCSAGCPGMTIAGPPESEAVLLHENFNPKGQLVEQMNDGATFVAEMCKTAESLNDYSLVFETKTFKKNSSVTEKGVLYFKKPKLMRIEELGEYNKGSVAVLGKDGKAHARGAGLASLVTLTMKPDDHMLDAANGDKMEDSDFISLTKLLRDRLKDGSAARVSEKAVVMSGVGEPTFVLEIFHPDDPKTIQKRIYVSTKTNLPIRWDDYDYKEPCLSTWKDVKMNTGLSDDLFKL